MSFFSKIFKSKQTPQDAGWRTGGLEDFMMLIRVYYQATMAAQLGISNLAALPDLRVFKQTLHVATVNNKLGVGEKTRCRKMLGEIYGLDDYFFREIDQSVKRGCRNMNEMQQYLYRFQDFSQDLMMLMGNLMKWKFRLPGFLHGALKQMTAKTVHDVLTRPVWKDEGVRRACEKIRASQQRLGYSEQWITDYVACIVLLAKKEPKAAALEEGTVQKRS